VDEVLRLSCPGKTLIRKQYLDILSYCTITFVSRQLMRLELRLLRHDNDGMASVFFVMYLFQSNCSIYSFVMITNG
jgi:hypothetical protein